MNLAYNFKNEDRKNGLLCHLMDQTKVEVELSELSFGRIIVLKVKNEHLPASWFITNNLGQVVMSGVTDRERLIIFASQLNVGNYKMRMLGEVIDFQISEIRSLEYIN